MFILYADVASLIAQQISDSVTYCRFRRVSKGSSKLPESYIIDGKKHGPFKTYHPNGQLESEATYKDGKLHKLFKQYFSDGKLESEGTYKDGKKT